MLGDRLRHQIQGRLHEGQLDPAALPRPALLSQTEQSAEHGMQPRLGIRRTPRIHRTAITLRSVRITRHPGHAGELLHGLRKPDPVAPRPIETKSGHAHENKFWIRLGKAFPGEAELIHHPGGEIFDQGIRLRDQSQQEIDALRARQVEGDRSLAQIRRREGRSVLPPLILRRRAGRAEAHSIGPLNRLDVNDLCPQQRKGLAAPRPGPERRAVENPQSGERQPFAGLLYPMRCILPGRPVQTRRRQREDFIAVLIQSRCGLEWARLPAVGLIGHTRLEETASRVVLKDPPLPQMVHSGKGAAVADRRHGNPQELGTLQQFRRRARPRVGLYAVPQLFRVGEPAYHRLELASFAQLGALDQHTEILPLLTGENTEADEAVRGRLDPRDLVRRGNLPDLREAPPGMRDVRESGRHRFEQ